MKRSLLALVLAGCTWLPLPIAPRADRIVWDHEPTVGTDSAELEPDVRTALSEWNWGEYVGPCPADICVTRGALEEGDRHWGMASWASGTSCDANVRVHTYVVVAHEIGHCFGLGHSHDRRSIMFEYVRDPFERDALGQWVTHSDRQVLRSIQP